MKIKKYYIPASIIGAIILIGIIFLISNQQNIMNGPSQEEVKSQTAVNNNEAQQIRSQLGIALQSGGITPESYEEIKNKIDTLENQGHDSQEISELREMLSRLSVGGQGNEQIQTTTVQNQYQETTTFNSISQNTTSGIIIWDDKTGKWEPNINPPACPDPLVLQSPVDLNLVTSILYPGQVRGGDFKPHGGFRTDGATGSIEVKAPIEGYVWRVAKFTDGGGIHYMFDIQHPCGIMYRLGHLSAVPPDLEPIFDNLPEREFGDSRTTVVEPVHIKLGQTIATNTQQGTGFDWGVYDLRNENEASKDPAFREAHKDEYSQAYYAICWLDYLPADQQSIVKSLPAADGISGKNSDYCKIIYTLAKRACI